jgi:uncharacterized iron-regulated membrane protein
MASLRRAVFWCHLAAGVSAGVVILIMSVTGLALTYQKEMQYWADTHHFVVLPPPDGARAPIADLLAAVRGVEPDAEPTAVAWRADPAAPVGVTRGAETVYVDPYTCEVFGPATGGAMRAFFAQVTSWHRYLAMTGDGRPRGRAITGAANGVFLCIVLSGMYLWWPRIWNARQFRQVMWFRRGVQGRARDFNWHNTFGFLFALPLAIVVASGVVISYPWASNAVYRVMGETPPLPGAGRGGGAAGGAPAARRSVQVSSRVPELDDVTSRAWDRAVAQAMGHTPSWTAMSLRMPASAAAPLVFTIDRGDAGQPNLRGTLTIDPATDAAGWEDFRDATAGRRARTILRFAHTGEIGGLAGQTVAGLASAAGAVLVYSGLALSVRRLAAWRRRRALAGQG